MPNEIAQFASIASVVTTSSGNATPFGQAIGCRLGRPYDARSRARTVL